MADERWSIGKRVPCGWKSRVGLGVKLWWPMSAKWCGCRAAPRGSGPSSHRKSLSAKANAGRVGAGLRAALVQLPPLSRHEPLCFLFLGGLGVKLRGSCCFLFSGGSCSGGRGVPFGSVLVSGFLNTHSPISRPTGSRGRESSGTPSRVTTVRAFQVRWRSFTTWIFFEFFISGMGRMLRRKNGPPTP